MARMLSIFLQAYILLLYPLQLEKGKAIHSGILAWKIP